MDAIIYTSNKGYKKAAKRYTVKAVCAVGMDTMPSDEQMKGLKKKYSDIGYSIQLL